MTVVTTLRIGTRKSRLALAQASLAVEVLHAVVGRTELVPLTTRGDALSARRPRGRWIATDGQFTGELERALLERRVELVVHSYKDLPTAFVPGLTIAAVLERADPRDCLIAPDGGGGLDDLPFGGRIGTSSTRRAAQLAIARADLIASPIRGNVETRLRRLEEGEYDGLLLAAAGLDRLGINVAERARLPLDVMLPAPAQGALAIQARSDDKELLAALKEIEHVPTRIGVEAERALLRRIGGGCLAPLGALGQVTDNTLRLQAAYEDESGTHVRADMSGPAGRPSAVVEAVAAQIAQAGTAA
ncbi:hydroxymethylbilane synthase [soil metagenome]